MSAFLKLIIDQHHVLDIMFLRSIFALIILLTLYKLKFFEVKKKYFKFHFFRTILGVSAMFFTFTALKYIPISNLTIINFSKIFFILPLAIILLKEKTHFSELHRIKRRLERVKVTLEVQTTKLRSKCTDLQMLK